MNHAKIFSGIVLASALLSVSAINGAFASPMSSNKADYHVALDSASKSLKSAKSAGFEWRDSSKILKKAEKAAKSGDFNLATRLVNKAKRQGDMALAQAKIQANAGPRL